MKKPLKFLALLLTLSIAVAPYAPFIGHTLVHLMTGDHHYSEDSKTHHDDHKQEHDHHLLFLTPLPSATVVSNFKIQPDVKTVELDSFYESTIVNQHDVFYSFLEKDLPPQIKLFLSLSIHAANAPPL